MDNNVIYKRLSFKIASLAVLAALALVFMAAYSRLGTAMALPVSSYDGSDGGVLLTRYDVTLEMIDELSAAGIIGSKTSAILSLFVKETEDEAGPSGDFLRLSHTGWFYDGDIDV